MTPIDPQDVSNIYQMMAYVQQELALIRTKLDDTVTRVNIALSNDKELEARLSDLRNRVTKMGLDK